MRVTFLGTGTSHGIPRIGCDCAVCRSTDSRNQRLRPAALVEHHGASLLIDAPPDLRMQALRVNLRRVDAVLLTHAHADHALGLDDLRVFTEGDHKLPVYGMAESLADIQRVFPYACTAVPAWPGIPRFDLRPLPANVDVTIAGLKVRALPVRHYQVMIYGYLIAGQVAYVTDCSEVPPPVLETLRGVPVLVLDGLRHRPHLAHLTVAQAVAVGQAVGAKLTLLTHVCHELDHQETENQLPPGIRLAYDGLQVEIENGAVQMLA